jgi:hypothetical protein
MRLRRSITLLASLSAVAFVVWLLLYPRSFWVSDEIILENNQPQGAWLISSIRGLRSVSGLVIFYSCYAEIQGPEIFDHRLPPSGVRVRWKSDRVRAAPRFGDKGTFRSALGIHAERFHAAPYYCEHVAVPYWTIGILCVTWPFIFLRRAHRRHRRLGANQCPTCGYDLRASKDKCPECGTPIRTPPPKQSNAETPQKNLPKSPEFP